MCHEVSHGVYAHSRVCYGAMRHKVLHRVYVHGSVYLPQEYLHIAGTATQEHATQYVACGIGTQRGLLHGATWLMSTTRPWLFPPPHLW